MKHTILFTILLGSTMTTMAQQLEYWSEVPVLLDSYSHKISPDGAFSNGEIVSGDGAWARDNISGQVYTFNNASCGVGNNITKDYIIVGTDKTYMKGAFLIPDENTTPVLIPSLSEYENYVNGINWDGTRLVGFMANPNRSSIDEINPELQNMAYLPFYCDVEPESLTVSEPHFLPVPRYDFFGLPPQYCTAFWISDDATTILGQVIDNSGAYIYPIVYKQAQNGEWSYLLPSEKLFNPNGLEIPRMPQPSLEQPLAQNFIGNPEFKALFEELLDAYLSGDSTINPYLMLDPSTAGSDALMTIDEWDEYQEALQQYMDYYNTVYQQELDNYYDQYSRFISQSTNFLQSSMAMNREGTLIGQTRIVTRFSGINPVTYLNPVIFDLDNNSFKVYGGEYDELEISQILPDGTLIAAYTKPGYTTPDLTPQHSYVCEPGTSNFITIENYLKNSNPEYYEWYQEYLTHEVPIGYDENEDLVYIDLTVSGLVAVSDDFSTLSAGVDGWAWDLYTGNYFSYFFSNIVRPDAGIEELMDSTYNNSLKIYNLQGFKVMETKDKNEISSLPKGIYIINGKKFFVK